MFSFIFFLVDIYKMFCLMMTSLVFAYHVLQEQYGVSFQLPNVIPSPRVPRFQVYVYVYI